MFGDRKIVMIIILIVIDFTKAMPFLYGHDYRSESESSEDLNFNVDDRYDRKDASASIVSPFHFFQFGIQEKKPGEDPDVIFPKRK